jgi:Domain of unknown function (DUF6457)
MMSISKACERSGAGTVAPVNATQWLAAYADKLGTDAPTKDELKTVLDLAGVAAHSSERIAAPVACWLAARAGVELEEAMRLARDVAPDG